MQIHILTRWIWVSGKTHAISNQKSDFKLSGFGTGHANIWARKNSRNIRLFTVSVIAIDITHSPVSEMVGNHTVKVFKESTWNCCRREKELEWIMHRDSVEAHNSLDLLKIPWDRIFFSITWAWCSWFLDIFFFLEKSETRSYFLRILENSGGIEKNITKIYIFGIILIIRIKNTRKL